MPVEISIKTCQSIDSKILMIFEVKNSQAFWGQPLVVSLKGRALRVGSHTSVTASMDVPVFSYDSQYLAKPEILEFVNGNIGLGYWMDKTSLYIQSQDFETIVKTKNPILYEDFIKSKIERPVNAASQVSKEENRMNNEQYVKGQTFDVFPGESDRRYLFDYYLFDVNTDEVMETGALIVPGATMDEATRNAIQKMQAKVADKVSSTVKVHLNFIKTFTKPKAEEDTFQKMADAIARGVREGIKQ